MRFLRLKNLSSALRTEKKQQNFFPYHTRKRPNIYATKICHSDFCTLKSTPHVVVPLSRSNAPHPLPPPPAGQMWDGFSPAACFFEKFPTLFLGPPPVAICSGGYRLDSPPPGVVFKRSPMSDPSVERSHYRLLAARRCVADVPARHERAGPRDWRSLCPWV